MTPFERYIMLRDNVDEAPEAEQDAMLDEMDDLWWTMSTAERDIVDPAGAAARVVHRASL